MPPSGASSLSFVGRVVLLRLNSLRWTSICTGAAVDTCVGVDDILGLAFGDGLIGTFIDASSTLDTIVRDYVSHC